MANTIVPTTPNRRSLTVKTISADWDFSDFAAYSALLGSKTIKVIDMIFFPSAAGDILMIKDGSDTGAEFPLNSVDGGAIHLSLDKVRLRPIIDFSDSTISDGNSARFTLIYEIDPF